MDPSEEDYLQAQVADVKGPRHAIIAAKIVQFRAIKQLNHAKESALHQQIRAEESALYQQIMADINAAKAGLPS